MKEINKYIQETLEVRQSHLRLDEECCVRGGNSTQHRGVLAEYLNTSFPAGYQIHLCHACFNENCSNPRHLYWGTKYENNVLDQRKAGTLEGGYIRTLRKYGLEEIKKILKQRSNKIACSKGGLAGKGKPKSEEHRKKLSESLRGRKQNRNR